MNPGKATSDDYGVPNKGRQKSAGYGGYSGGGGGGEGTYKSSSVPDPGSEPGPATGPGVPPPPGGAPTGGPAPLTAPYVEPISQTQRINLPKFPGFPAYPEINFPAKNPPRDCASICLCCIIICWVDGEYCS